MCRSFMDKPLCIQFETLTEHSGLNKPEQIWKLLMTFRADIASILVRLNDSIQSKNRKEIQKHAHAAKGGAFSIQAISLAENLAKINDFCLTAEFEELECWFNDSIPHYLQVLDDIDAYIQTNNLYSSIKYNVQKVMVVSDATVSKTLVGKMLKKFDDPVVSSCGFHEFLGNHQPDNDLLFIIEENNIDACLQLIRSVRQSQVGIPINAPIALIGSSHCAFDPNDDKMAGLQVHYIKEMNLASVSSAILRMVDWKHVDSTLFFR